MIIETNETFLDRSSKEAGKILQSGIEASMLPGVIVFDRLSDFLKERAGRQIRRITRPLMSPRRMRFA